MRKKMCSRCAERVLVKIARIDISLVPTQRSEIQQGRELTPSAMAPPFGLTFFASSPSVSMTIKDCDANAVQPGEGESTRAEDCPKKARLAHPRSAQRGQRRPW